MPNNSEQLRKDLQTNTPFLFTLIQKFRYDRGKIPNTFKKR